MDEMIKILKSEVFKRERKFEQLSDDIKTLTHQMERNLREAREWVESGFHLSDPLGSSASTLARLVAEREMAATEVQRAKSLLDHVEGLAE